MIDKWIYTSALLVALSACGGGGDPEEMVDDTPEVAGETQGDSDSGETPNTPETPETPATDGGDPEPSEAPKTVTYAPQRVTFGTSPDGQITSLIDGAVVTLQLSEDKIYALSPNRQLADGFVNGGVTIDDQVRVAHLGLINGGRVGLGLSNVDGDRELLVYFERLGDAEVPTTGSANYAGGYIGIMTEGTTNVSFKGLGIHGDFEATVDFAEGEFTGEISNRTLYDLNTLADIEDVASNNLILGPFDLGENGQWFAPIASGGEFVEGDIATVILNRSFSSGMIVGSGEQTGILGATTLYHEGDGVIIAENGVFQAKQE